jgi:hypothetical protein
MKKKEMTAGDILDSFKNDPEYVKMKEQKEKEWLKSIADLEAESSVFVQECSRFGYNLKTPGCLVKEKNLDPDLVALVIKYLYETHYSKGFRLGLAHSLTVPEAAYYFSDILDLFKKEKDIHVRYYLGVALSDAAKKQDDMDIIEHLIFDKEVGVERNALLGAIKRMKGEQRERTLTFAREDPELKINLHIFGLHRSVKK